MENDKKDLGRWLADSELHRLATFQGVDLPAGVFVLPLTGAGFYRPSSCGQHQVVCCCCPLLLDLRKLAAQSPHALTHHGVLALHRQLSSSCPFVQQFFQNQHLSHVHAQSLPDNGAAVSSDQEQAQAISPRLGVADSDFSVLNGNPRRLTPLGQREDWRSVIHPGRVPSSSSVKTRASNRRSTADDVANRGPLASPDQRSSPNNMASGGPFSPFDQDKGDPHQTALAFQDSVLGGPEDDDLVTDSVQDNAEEQDGPPPETQPSDIDFGGHLKERRRRARQQSPQSAPQPAWQQAGAAGGPQNQLVGLASRPGMPQPSKEREGRNSREQGVGASRVNARELAIETQSAKFPCYAIERDRLSSFRGWNYASPRREDLAEAGFFYAGNGDSVKCFQCGVILKQWEPTDDPWVEHARWRSTCSFVRISKSPEFLSAVRTLSDRNAASPGSPPIQLSDVEQEMTKLNAQHQPPAGWDDVPEAMNGEDENDQQMANDEVKRTLEGLENENRSLRDNFICKICMDRDVSVIFLPCAHLVTCSTCAPVPRHCPVCRSDVLGTVRMQME